MVVTLLAGIVGTTLGLIAADARRREAERNLAFATKGNEILGSIFEGLDPRANYSTVAEFSGALRDGLKKAVRELDGAAIGDPLIVAAMQAKLGQSLTSLGEVPDAIVVLKKSLETRKPRLGPDHPETLASMHKLAEAYVYAEKLDLAIPLHEETLKIRKAKLGPDHPETLTSMSNLASAYNSATKLNLAVPLYEETFMLRKAKLGPDNPRTLMTMASLGRSLLKSKAFARAEPLLRECLAIRQKARPGDRQTFDTESLLGGALLGQKQYADAEPYLRQGYEGMKQREKAIPPWNATALPEALDRLIELEKARNRPDEVKKWQAERVKYPQAASPTQKKM